MPPSDRQPLPHAERRDVAVIGAGLVGLACARALQKRGRAVTLLDPRAPASGVSSGNAGLIAGSAVIPEASGETLRALPRLLVSGDSPVSVRLSYLPRLAPYLWHFAKASRAHQFDRLSRAMAGLSLVGFDHWMTLLEDLEKARALFRRDGCLYLYLSDDERRRAERENAVRRDRGMPLRELSAAEVKERLPDLGVKTAGAVLAESAGHVLDPGSLGELLFESIVADGGEFLRERVTGLAVAGDRVRALRTASGDEIPAQAVVLAAGAYSKTLAARLGAAVPLDTQRGYHVMVRKSGVSVDLPMLVPAAGIAVTPMRKGLRFAGLVEFAGLEAEPTPARTRQIEGWARRLFPALVTRQAETWMGHRPSLPDGLPIIDRAPGAANACLAFGHGQMGLTQAAVTGHAIAALVCGNGPPIDLAPYRAARFRRTGSSSRAA